MGLTDRMKPDEAIDRMVIITENEDAARDLNVLASKILENYKSVATGKKVDLVLVVAVSAGTFEVGSCLEPKVPDAFVKDFGYALRTLCKKYWRIRPKDPNHDI